MKFTFTAETAHVQEMSPFCRKHKLPNRKGYFRQLTVCTFGIHNLKTKNMTCYVYHEGEAGKGANDVCSFLKQYFDQDKEQKF